MTTKTKDLNEMCERLFELDAKRTQGVWFWSARTLRSEIPEKDEDGDEQIIERPDILGRDNDGCVFAYKEADADLIALLPEAISAIREYQRRERIAREALEYYGLKRSVKTNLGTGEKIEYFDGDVAQQALKQLGGEDTNG